MQPDPMARKEFLALLCGASAMTGCTQRNNISSLADGASHAGAEPSDTSADARAGAFADRVTDDVARILLGALSYIGDRLGLFKKMAEIEWCTPERLAGETGCNLRLIQEWLKAMVAAEYVTYDAEQRRYRLPPAHAAVLADEDSPFFLAGMIEAAVPGVLATHNVMDAFRTGKPITPDVFHPDMWEGIERSTAPFYKHRLVQAWLAAMPEVTRNLHAGGAAVDIGCGAGRAAITIAQAFPEARVFGYDPFAPSIERAKQNAVAANVAERTTFVISSVRDLPAGRFDLASAFWVVHHMSDPVGDFRAIRRALTETGSFLVMEDAISPDLAKNRTPVGRLVYAWSAMACLHDSMADDGAGLGTADASTIRRLARQAGFTRMRRLPVDDTYVSLYELRA